MIFLKNLSQGDKQKEYLNVKQVERNVRISRSNTHIGLQRENNSAFLIASRPESLKNEIITFQEQLSKKNAHQYCLMIIKKRNLALFLLKCCQIVAKLDLVECNTAVQTSFLLLKKSTIIMSELSKLMSNGRHPEINIPQKQLGLFFKTADFFKLQYIVSRNFNFSTKYLNQMAENIAKDYSNLLQKAQFCKQNLSQEIKNQYFQESIIDFLKKCIQSRRINKSSKDNLKYLLIMSYIIDFHSYEQMFNQVINQEIIQLQNQTLFIKISEMDKQVILDKLMQVLQKVENFKQRTIPK